MTSRWPLRGGAAVAIAASFLLGLWTRPESRRSEPGKTSAGSEFDPPSRSGRVSVASGPSVPVRGVPRDPVVVASSADDVLTQIALGMEVAELFTAQARDDAWAPRVEQFLATKAGSFVDTVIPEAEGLRVECKTSICRIEIVVSAERWESALARQQAMPLGEVMQPWREELDDPSRVRVGLHVAYGSDTREIGALERMVEEAFTERFQMPLADVREYFDRDEAQQSAEGSP